MDNCKDCKKLWTCDCPIRVWGRNERNKGEKLDVEPERDFCSRFVERDVPVGELDGHITRRD